MTFFVNAEMLDQTTGDALCLCKMLIVGARTITDVRATLQTED